MKPIITLLFIALFSLGNSSYAAEYLDLPPCHALTAADGKYRLGLTMPLKNPDLATRSYELGMFYQDLSLCQTSWDTLLPTWQAQSPIPELERYYGYGIYAGAFIISLMLFALLPYHWRRQMTLLGLLAIAISTFLLGATGLWLSKKFALPQNFLYQEVVLLQKSGAPKQWLDIAGVWELDEYLMRSGLTPDFTQTRLMLKNNKPDTLIARDSESGQITQQYSSEQFALASTGKSKISDAGLLLELTQTTPDNTTQHIWVAAQDLPLKTPINNPQGKQFRVHNVLNIRRQAGTQSATIKNSPLHRGTVVEVIAPPQGDWWKVRVPATGDQGWVNSLWLRSIGGHHE